MQPECRDALQVFSAARSAVVSRNRTMWVRGVFLFDRLGTARAVIGCVLSPPIGTPTMTRNRLAPLAVALGAVACTNNPYVIGAVCPPFDAGAVADPRCGGSGSGATFGVDFATSGASQLGALALPSGDVAPVWRLLGQGASATSWTADVGGSLGVMSGAQASDAAPFTDGTRAAQLAATPTYVAADATTGAVGADDFALEVVLRGAAGASVLDKRAGATGW